MLGERFGGIHVHIGARVAATAGPGEIVVSSTVRDLVDGSAIAFDHRGTFELKGVRGARDLFTARVDRRSDTRNDPGRSASRKDGEMTAFAQRPGDESPAEAGAPKRPTRPRTSPVETSTATLRRSTSRRTTRSSPISRASAARSRSTSSSSTRRSHGPARGGRRARRPARQRRRADRHAQPRPAALRPAVLDRRQQPARRPRGAGRSGAAGRASSSRSRRPRQRSRERIEQELEVAHADPAELPAARAARPARLAGRGVLPAGPRGRRRLLRLLPARRTAASPSSSATSPTRACRPRW